ncbi:MULTISPECIES: tRNA lysidine(34) synthetase TilS [Gordonibacter]|uniref:tRNA(Ile)-lysidine synthase n=1 Tax=Gordonibacter faecis TaxID=3047475 RepID=A0ABT7DL83_9ACTN|nr:MULTISPECIES: tRNA lysidine(34) synthetase TilS [unclassified Gordonibacter]MDJ1650167.1 tRNA lysidine(34) synthetase TilS [Gordonibacter sp. KGMB12511]
MDTETLVERAAVVLAERDLADGETPALLMVSGGSDSTALAYVAAELHERGDLGPLALLHVNHQLRGRDADDDARFVAQLAELLGIPLFSCEVDVGREAERTGENVEAVARRERYLAANEALESLCRHAAAPLSDGRILTAHTLDDRVESFYMRSIVGTGPGGFRSMRYRNGPVVRPLMDESRASLRAYLEERREAGLPVALDDEGCLWREDATNAHTDRFRAYVRHEIVPRVKERNPQLLDVLRRTMNLIADEDDLLEDMTDEATAQHVQWLEEEDAGVFDPTGGFLLAPELGGVPRPLQRRVVVRVLGQMLGAEARVETSTVEAVLAAFDEQGAPRGGYVANVQGDVAVSANKRGVRVEPMAAFRARRKRG